jgi:hypothetical protein
MQSVCLCALYASVVKQSSKNFQEPESRRRGAPLSAGQARERISTQSLQEQNLTTASRRAEEFQNILNKWKDQSRITLR